MKTSRKFRARSGIAGFATNLPVLALAASLAIAIAAAGCDSQAAASVAAPPAPEVSVAQVLSKQVRQWDEFTGRVSAVETVELRPRVSGYVERVAYQEGQDVARATCCS